MIITLTGMPCSGKSSVAAYLKEKYGFEIIKVSQKMRVEAEKLGMNILEFNEYLLQNDLGGKFDRDLDDWTRELGEKRRGEKLIFDSRLAWHFVPESFKVFLDCSQEVMLERLKGSDRAENEKNVKDENGLNSLMQRVRAEDSRYVKIYGFSYLDKANYDLVVDTSGKNIEQVAEEIYKNYCSFCSVK